MRRASRFEFIVGGGGSGSSVVKLILAALSRLAPFRKTPMIFKDGGAGGRSKLRDCFCDARLRDEEEAAPASVHGGLLDRLCRRYWTCLDAL